MKYIIQGRNKVLSKRNGQFLVFDTAEDAMRHIEDVCNNSPYLKPKLLKNSK